MELGGGTMKAIRLSVSSVALMQLAACGGGGGGDVSSTPTPTPTPPSTANADLLGPSLLSESFTNDAATGSASYPKSGATPTRSASQSTATLVYEAATQKYTVSVGSRNQSFLPSDIDNAQSTSAIAVYVKRSGSTTDSLTLTKPGTSGRFTYKYVAGGFWQKTVDGASTISGDFDAIAYGVDTLNAGVPRIGYGAYSVDLLGAQTLSDNVHGITGQGTLLADFAGGQIVTHGSIDNASPFGVAQFSGSARLSSSDGTFGGTIGFTGNNIYNGSLNGRFYGPAADEVGAAFSAAASDGNVVVGALVGRHLSVPGGNTTVTNLTSAEFLKGDSARLAFDGAQSGPTVSVQSHSTTGIAVYFDPAQGTYDLLLGDRAGQLTNIDFIQLASLSNQTGFFAAVAPGGHYASFDPRFGTPSSLRYLRAGRSYTVNGVHYRFDDMIFGIATPDSALPRTGEGGYVVSLTGSIAQTGASDLQTISGTGNLIADFANSSLITDGALFNYFGGPILASIGTFNGTGTISSSANSFTGTLNFAGPGNYSGGLKGRFYGPTADEVGAVFSLDGTNGSVATGTLYGARDATVLAARTPLTQITVPTDLFGIAEYSFIEPLNGQGQTFGDPNIKVSYDPSSGTYSFVTQTAGISGGAVPLNNTVAATDIVSSSSNASYTIYHNSSVDGRILNPGRGNPTIALTYTSLADLTYTGNRNGTLVTTEYFVPFGAQTPVSQIPRTGTGNYTGIVLGHGDQHGFSNDAWLNGTSALNIDFGTGQGNASLTLTATDKATLAQMPLGTFNFAGGTIAIAPAIGNTFFFNPTSYTNLPNGGAVSGNFSGSFFGANAAEFGGVFALHVSDGSGQSANGSHFEGATVGKR